MNLKETIVLGLMAAVLAVPAFALEEEEGTMKAAELTSSTQVEQKEVTPAKKNVHKKGHENTSKDSSSEAKTPN